MGNTGGFGTNTLATKIPPTHIRLETQDGTKFRLTYFEKLAKWENNKNIATKMETILKERGTQRVNLLNEVRGQQDTLNQCT